MKNYTPSVSNTYHFGFCRYNLFVTHLDTHYVQIHNKREWQVFWNKVVVSYKNNIIGFMFKSIFTLQDFIAITYYINVNCQKRPCQKNYLGKISCKFGMVWTHRLYSTSFGRAPWVVEKNIYVLLETALISSWLRPWPLHRRYFCLCRWPTPLLGQFFNFNLFSKLFLKITPQKHYLQI
jgi:hypothetical protein